MVKKSAKPWNRCPGRTARARLTASVSWAAWGEFEDMILAELTAVKNGVALPAQMSVEGGKELAAKLPPDPLAA